MPEECIYGGPCNGCGRCGKLQAVTALDAYQSSNEGFEPRSGLGLAVDLGTTTIVMEALDLSTGRSIAKTGFENPQRIYGADVISRISAANQDHAEELRKLVCDAITVHAGQISSGGITDCVISGNTTMIHLLLGYDPSGLGVYPFEIKARLEEIYTWQEIFGESLDCPVFIMPWISAFVGGDVVSGLLSAPEAKNFLSSYLLVDLGTNGEIALCRGGAYTCTATAAGPAFEGMRAGLYGSEILDIAARLRREGTMDETGLLLGPSPLTQKEIREIQLAKSAVRVGIEILLDEAGRPTPDKIYLCGGFGQALDPESAIEIGLFPQAMQGKITPLGNASLAGAARLLRNPAARKEITTILTARHLNLSEHPDFFEYFMEYMGFE